jgi:hypothetical protein
MFNSQKALIKSNYKSGRFCYRKRMRAVILVIKICKQEMPLIFYFKLQVLLHYKFALIRTKIRP